MGQGRREEEVVFRRAGEKETTSNNKNLNTQTLLLSQVDRVLPLKRKRALPGGVTVAGITCYVQFPFANV